MSDSLLFLVFSGIVPSEPPARSNFCLSVAAVHAVSGPLEKVFFQAFFLAPAALPAWPPSSFFILPEKFFSFFFGSGFLGFLIVFKRVFSFAL